MMSINDFIHENNLKNEATSKIKIQHMLSSLALNDVKVKIGHAPFSCDVGIVVFHQSNGICWVAYTKQNFSDSYGCLIPNNLYKFIVERNGFCF